MSRFAIYLSAVSVLFHSPLFSGELLYPAKVEFFGGETHSLVPTSNVVRAGRVDREFHCISNFDKDFALTAQWADVGLYVRNLPPKASCRFGNPVVHDWEFITVPSEIRHGKNLELVESVPARVAKQDAGKRKGMRKRERDQVLKSHISRSGTNDKLKVALFLQSSVEGRSVKCTVNLAKWSAREEFRFAIPFLTDMWENSGLEQGEDATLVELSAHDAKVMGRSSLVTYPIDRQEQTAVIRTRSAELHPRVVPVCILLQGEIILAGRVVIHGPEDED